MWEALSYDEQDFDSQTSSQGEICPYCYMPTSTEDLVEHLDRCDIYHEIAVSSLPSHYRTPPEVRSLEESLGSDNSENTDQESPPPQHRRPFRSVTTNSAGSCPICYNNYNSERVMPLILPACGHTCCQRCLIRMVDQQTGNLKCPVCRAHHFRDVESLPVNYALLELAESGSSTEVCEKHNKELVGFCIQDHELICGVCMFEHRDHEVYPFESPAIQLYAKSNLDKLKDKEKRLIESEAKWRAVHQDAKETQKAIDELLQYHIAGIKEAEETLIKEVRHGAKTCIGQVKSHVAQGNMPTFAANITANLSQIKAELAALQQHKAQFSSLPTLQKLQMLATKPQVAAPDQFNPLKNVRKRLAVQVDYQAAVKSAAFPIDPQ